MKQKELSDSNLNQIALIFSDKYCFTVADDREMLPNRCHDNGLITAFGLFTPCFSGCLLFPLDLLTRKPAYYGCFTAEKACEMAVLFKNLPAVWFHVAKMLPSECNDLKQFYISCFSYFYYSIVSGKYQVSNINLL